MESHCCRMQIRAQRRKSIILALLVAIVLIVIKVTFFARSYISISVRNSLLDIHWPCVFYTAIIAHSCNFSSLKA